MAFTTYAELEAEVASWLHRDDLAAQIPGFITLAEAKFNRDIFVPDREAVDSATVDSGTVALPADFSAMRAIYVDASPDGQLEQMSLAELRLMYRAGVSGTPRHFAIQRGREIVLGPAPAGATTLVLNYYETIPALSATNTVNWLLTAYPDAYLQGALHQAAIYLRDAEAIAYCEAETDKIIDRIKKFGNRKANGGSPMAPRVPVFNIRGVRA